MATATFTANQANDCIAALLPAWKLAWHHSLQLPEYVGLNVWITQGPAGALSNRLPGVIVWAIPFYRVLGNSSAPTFYPAAVAAASAVGFGTAAFYMSVRRLVSQPVALGAAAILVLGTGIWTSAADALWPHGPDMLWLGLTLWALSRKRPAPAGFALAFAVLTRPHLAVVAAVVGLWLAVTQRSWKPLLQMGPTSALGVIGLIAWTRLVWGEWGVLPSFYAARVTTATDTVAAGTGTDLGAFAIWWDRVGGLLVSPGRGLLIYSPFLLFLLPGVRPAWRVAPTWVRASAVGGVGYMATQLLGNSFGGGDGFTSYRLPIEMVVLLSPLLCLSWTTWTQRRRWRRHAFALTAWLAVVQHAIGAFVGHDDHVVRDPWRSYGLASRLPMATTAELLLLLGVALVSAVLLRRVAVHPFVVSE